MQKIQFYTTVTLLVKYLHTLKKQPWQSEGKAYTFQGNPAQVHNMLRSVYYLTLIRLKRWVL